MQSSGILTECTEEEAEAELYDPCGAVEERVFEHAPRLASLRGCTVALLGNQKRNADRLLSLVGQVLIEEYGVGSVHMESKESMSLPAPSTLLKRLAQASEALVVAVGDCGSCSATSTMDAISAERLGLPAVPIVTEQFQSGAEMVASIQGAETFPMALVAHPVATIDKETLHARAQQAAEQVVAILRAP